MKVKTLAERESFQPDYRVAWLSVLGLLGFISGCLILFGGDIFDGKNEGTVFQEIRYNPREIADNLLRKPIDSLRKVIEARQLKIGPDEMMEGTGLAQTDPNADTEMAEREKKMKAAEREKSKNSNNKPKTAKTDTIALKQKQESDFNIFNKLNGYAIDAGVLSQDDASDFDKLNRALHFSISPSTLKSWQEGSDTLGSNWKDSVRVSFKDEAVPFPITGQAVFSIQSPGSDIAFITKYPASGTWLLLILIFTSFCFAAVSTSIVLSGKLVKLLKDNGIKKTDSWTYWLFVIIVAVVLFLLAWLWKLSFYDEEVIKNLLFMDSLSNAMWWTIRIGYIAGAFCLAGFIYSAGSLGFIRDNLTSLRELTANTNEVVKGKEGDLKEKNEVVKGKEGDVKENNKVVEEKKRHEIIYLNLLKYFNTYFFLSSIILSLMVLCTGGLYATANSLDFVKLLADDWGYSPARSEFIYLYGGLHTVILLLVYVPTKMRFSEIVIEDPKPTTNGEKKWYDIIKNPFSSLKEMLIAVSPLLASVIQSLFDILFQ